MKNKIRLIFFSLLFFSSLLPNGQTNKLRYFDHQGKEISKSKFNRILDKSTYLDVPGDTLNSKKLIARENSGNLNNKHILISLLEQSTRSIIDTMKPIVIIYYPGGDPCNNSGTSDSNWIKEWYDELELELFNIAQIKPFYIFKDASGLEKYKDIISWIKDPEGIVERLFFKYHYPCDSFVVISKSGEYYSYFGEFPKEYVWEATKMLIKAK